MDPKTWLMFVTTFAIHFVNGAVSGFGAIIVRSFGYAQLLSILLIGCVGIVVSATLLLTGVLTLYISNLRTIIMALCQLPVIVGSVMIWKVNWTSSRSAAIAGFLLLGTFAASYMMMLAVSAANTAGHTKKVFTSGLLWCASAISNGVAPLTVRTEEVSEHYPSCFTATVATATVAVIGSLTLRLYLQWRNNVRDRQHRQLNELSAENCPLDDATDLENPLFRYVF